MSILEHSALLQILHELCFFLLKLKIVCYRTATFLRRWPIIVFFFKNNAFSLFIPFRAASFWHIFQKESAVRSFYGKVAV